MSLHHLNITNIRSAQQVEGFVESILGATIKSSQKQSQHLSLWASCCTLPTSEAWFCQYGAPIALQFPESDIFRIQFHHKGHGSTKIGQSEHAVTPDQAVVSYSAPQINFGHNFEQQLLRFSYAGLAQKITALTGLPLSRRLEFDPTFNPHAPQTSNLKRTFDFLISTVSVPEMKLHAAVISEIEQMLVTSLLYSCPNSYTSLLERQSLAAAPAQVCLVEEYIEANWDNSITMDDIAKLCGCSVRSIQRAFQQSRGYSPMAFLRQVRLQHAQEMLLTGEHPTITSVAFSCGYTDLGRFGQAYLRLFGERPSDTVKRKNQIKFNL